MFEYNKLTPMLKHYMDVKKDFQDALLLYRVGDFYECFFDDALTTSKVLQLTLTGKDCGHEQRAPMCGVPHHVIDTYVSKLVKKGYKVAICDQIQDPKEAVGLVKRAITRVISPGTITDIDAINKRENNYLLSIFGNSFGLAASYCDITTGKLVAFELKGNDNKIGKKLIDQIEKINPSEIIMNSKFPNRLVKRYLDLNKNIMINYAEDDENFRQKEKNVINHLGNENFDEISSMKLSIISLSNLLDYIYHYHEEKLVHINKLEILEIDSFLNLDLNTRKNLELSRNLQKNTRDDTVLKIIDMADTVMGSRLLNEWLERPLISSREINDRLDIVDFFYKNQSESSIVSSYLNDIYDLERLVAKISYARANARDLIALKNSIRNVPNLKKHLESLSDENISNIARDIPDVEELFESLDKSIEDDPPILITDGKIIKGGFDDKLDSLKEKSEHALDDLLNYENEEKENSGIKNLKIIFNKNNGYSIEITKSNLDKVPDNYIRKQTLKNQERYTSEKLEELSEIILGGTELINNLEYEIFQDIRNKVLSKTQSLQKLASIIAYIDSLNSLSKVAIKNNYVRPVIRNDNRIIIKDGRHPVIEKNLKENEFIANDTDIGEENNLIQIITGPNMAGKSTYMRQMAIIIIMAQMGSFVPANHAEISICDRVFTRIGAADNISKGESTFMLEMNEVSNILENATKDSFIVLDEVGRGTSSDDGLSIAMSLVDYLSKNKKVKTVFATHFHELTIMENILNNVVNLKIDILEENGSLIFLRKISKGKSDRSYGIEVAKMSGLPNELIYNAKKYMDSLDKDNSLPDFKEQANLQDTSDESIEKLEEIKNFAKKIDLNNTSPIEAINILYELVERIKES